MYDPVERAREIEKIVCRNDQRKYFRFRAARFYGGIATADCIGCNLSCVFCWSWPKVKSPGKYGRFNSAEEVAGNLARIARKRGFEQVRVSGNEPTIARRHLLHVLALLPPSLTFILETNGIMIGEDETYAEELSRFKNLHVRVSIKGTTEEEFTELTRAKPESFLLQLKALENLKRASVSANAAVMCSFSPIEKIRELQRRLKTISPEFQDIEVEELVLYGDIRKRLEKLNLSFRIAHEPRCIPPEQI